MEMIMELTQYEPVAPAGCDLLLGRRISFFAYAQKMKRFTGPLQNGSVNLGDGNICYVSMNHFETATATK
jgi:hypothetical protein